MPRTEQAEFDVAAIIEKLDCRPVLLFIISWQVFEKKYRNVATS